MEWIPHLKQAISILTIGFWHYFAIFDKLHKKNELSVAKYPKMLYHISQIMRKRLSYQHKKMRKWGICNEKFFSKHLETPSTCSNGFTGIFDFVLYYVCADGWSGNGVQKL